MPGETIIRFDGLGVEQDIREPKMKDRNLAPEILRLIQMNGS